MSSGKGEGLSETDGTLTVGVGKKGGGKVPTGPHFVLRRKEKKLARREEA